MALLLEKRGDEVKITEDIVKAAAGNKDSRQAIISLLLKRRPHKTVASISQSVCLTAATCGQQRVLDLLYRRRRFLPLRDKWVSIAAFYNAAKSGDIASVKQHLSKGTPPDMKNAGLETPLWIAAYNGRREVVERLSQREDVNVNSCCISGRPPIFWPMACGNKRVVSMLLTAGADPSFVDVDGDTPLSIAKKNGYEDVVRLLAGHK
ncbi:ankyrin repeat-containing protein [Diaporthe sp. PMI_573]|nr:ankyrin repeat-containing protein [Diaporthaceae sp. PMI_573]